MDHYQHHTRTHTHTRLTALCPGLSRWAGTRKVKTIWILLKQETVSGSGIRWAICKSEHRSRQITTPAPHHSVFYRPDALPAAQPTASKHWRHNYQHQTIENCNFASGGDGVVAQRQGVGLAIKRSRVRSPAGARLRNDSGQVVHTQLPRFDADTLVSI